MAKYVSLLWWAGMLIFCSCQNSGSTGEKGDLSAEKVRKLEALKAESKTRPYDRVPQQITKIKNSGLVETQGKALIYVPEGGLLDRNGKPFTGTAEIKVREALTMSDFIRYGLNTMSDKGILESGGMMEITASDTAGNPLNVNPETGLRLSMPIRSVEQNSPFTKTQLKKETDKKPDWQLFKAEKDENGTLLWKEIPKENQITAKDLQELQKYADYIEMKKCVAMIEKKLKDPSTYRFKSLEEIKKHKFKNGADGANEWESYTCKYSTMWLSKINYREFSYFDIAPAFKINGLLYVVFEPKEGMQDQYRYSENMIFNGTDSLSYALYQPPYPKKRIRLRFKETSFYNVIFDFTKEYQALKAKINELEANKAITEKLKQYEKELKRFEENRAQSARLEAVIQSSGWYNCDRYTKEEQFVGHFTVVGCDTSLLPFLQTAWVQPDINVRINPYLDSTGNHYTFQGVKEKRGFLLAWIPGWYVGSLECGATTNNQAGYFGSIKLQPADDKAIQTLIERLARNRNEPKEVIQ